MVSNIIAQMIDHVLTHHMILYGHLNNGLILTDFLALRSYLDLTFGSFQILLIPYSLGRRLNMLHDVSISA